ncbi:MAG: hypothetical protein Q9212_003605, partial [Teloschistes hypoglaucus]
MSSHHTINTSASFAAQQTKWSAHFPAFLSSVRLAVLSSIHYDATVTTTLATPTPTPSTTTTISPSNPSGFVTTIYEPTLPPTPPTQSSSNTILITPSSNPNGFDTTIWEPYPSNWTPSSPSSKPFTNATSANTPATATTTTMTTAASTPRLSHLPYYTTTTTTLHTTLSATISQVIHLSFPSAPSGDDAHTTRYTLPPLPTSADGKAWVEPLPIAVVTQLEAVVVDKGTAGRHKGQVLSTITAFASPPDVTASPVVVDGGGAGDGGGGGGSEVRTDVNNSW